MDKRLDKLSKEQREARLAYQRAWVAAHPERRRAYARKQYARNPAKHVARSTNTQLQQRYGITTQKKREFIAAQGGCCAICRRPFTSSVRTHVDHDHATGVVRGILCRDCNVGLGCFSDNVDFLDSAIEYLRRPR